MKCLLEVGNLEAGYGGRRVLKGVSLQVRPGEIVAIIGPNGAGKSTILKALAGMLPCRFDQVLWDGRSLGRHVSGGQTLESIDLGVNALYCPQGRRVFPGLSVLENLKVGCLGERKDETDRRIELALTLFPPLSGLLGRQADRLSGGEQQMVALARGLIARPKLMLLDEPSLGLAPKVVAQVVEQIRIAHQAVGTSFLIVEQRVGTALAFCDRVYGIRLGRVVLEEQCSEIRNNVERLKQVFL